MSHRSFADMTKYSDIHSDTPPETIMGVRVPKFRLPDPMRGHPMAWFLGPRGENFDLFAPLIGEALNSNRTFRLDFHPEDATLINEAKKISPGYLAGIDAIRQSLNELLSDLRDHTTPYYSWRYQGHMLWDTTIPALLGYFATMLHNPNNVTVQASTLTTLLELQVGWDLCAMLGFPFPVGDDVDQGPVVGAPHGHLTSGGTVANIEATWSARELRYLPLVVRDALAKPNGPIYWLPDSKKESVTAAYQGERREVLDLSEWELLNLAQDDILDLPRQILKLGPPDVPGDRSQPRWTERTVWELLLANSMNTLGIMEFHHRYLVGKDLPPIAPPVILAPASKHYSWPKAMALLGGGSSASSVVDVKVDGHGRMDMADLRKKLNRARAAWRPTLMVVGVAGSTEESSVDDISELLEIRREYRQQGYEFSVHVDAAWGGYFLSALRKDFADPGRHDKSNIGKFFDPGDWSYDPADASADTFDVSPIAGRPVDDLPQDPEQEVIPGQHRPAYPVFLSSHVVNSFFAIGRADSATIDPHKTGYTPYPAGAICYRNGLMRRLVTYGAPVIGTGQNATSVGEFGVEGSKPGASAASVYLSHAVIRPSHTGHGRLVNAAMMNAKIFWLGIVGLNRDNRDFIAVPLADPTGQFPSEQIEDGPRHDWFVDTAEGTFTEVLADLHELEVQLIHYDGAKRDTVSYDSLWRQVRDLGPDLNIVDYMFNFRHEDGSVNGDLRLLNRFNLAIYDRLHVATERIEGNVIVPDRAVGNISELPVIISKTDIWRATYGDDFVLPYVEKLGIKKIGPGSDAVRTILTTPSTPGSDPRKSEREKGEDRLDCYRKIAVLRSVVMDPFLHAEDLRGDFYVHEWMAEMRRVVADIARKFRGHDPDGNEGCAD